LPLPLFYHDTLRATLFTFDIVFAAITLYFFFLIFHYVSPAGAYLALLLLRRRFSLRVIFAAMPFF